MALKLEKFNSVSSIVKFILGRCHKSLGEVDVATDFFLNLMSEIQIQVPLSSIFDCVSEIIENHSNEHNKQLSLIALYKCLKRRIQNSEGKCVESRFKLASLCMTLNNSDDAIQEFRAVLELDADNILAMLNLSSLYLSSQNTIELGKIYIKIADFLKSQINLNEMDLDNPESEVNKCILYYNEALKLLPDNIDILLCLAIVSRMTDRHKESLGYIEQALRLDNKDYRVYYEAFLTYEAIGDFHTAKMMIRLCLFLNVSFVKAFNAFGNLMRKEKMYDCALSLFETAMLRVPEDVVLLNNYGTTYLEMGDKFKAKDIYLQAFFLDSNSFEINCNLAIIYKMECILFLPRQL
jgi:tetratricopeptide (TPR) repeat protein